MLEAIISHYTDGNKAKFATLLGLTPQTISAWMARNTFDSELIFTKCRGLSAKWLLSSGEGDMLVEQSSTTDRIYPEAIPLCPENANLGKPIPLVDAFAAAGFGNSDFSIAEQDVKEYYVVPKFKHCKVDFMIEVHGSSMWPKYNSGDVVACSILHESKFIQWNKCHVIATREQGILVKRIKQADDPNCLLAISDNKDYDPFLIPLDEITGVALVVGVIRLE